jgi:S-DNA-T family DNA segregation ATPase FtsK/SpoIIIE
MRRQARKLSRNGIQPMMMLSVDDKFAEVAGVVMARWAWHYRSELRPLLIAAVTMITAAVLHATHPVWPGIILAVTLATSGGLGAFGKRVGLPSVAERLYAVVVTAADGTWLTVATAAGPLRSPFPQLLVIVGSVLAVPWWVSHRRRARVRVERKLESWPEIAQSVGLAGSRVMSAVVDVWGWRARIGLARGQTIADVLAKLPAIESALGTVRGAARVLPTPDNLAHRFELRVLEIDPHADAIPWPGPSVATIAEPIDLGPFEDAAPARVLLLRRHALIGGIAGSGKSGGINVVMGNLSACRDVVIWAIDLKRGMELAPWASCIDRLATTPAQARMLLQDAVAILEARATMLTATGRRVWVPAADTPALVIVIDEYAELADDAPEATAYSDSIARRGRAVAVTLIAATQRPTQKAMGRGAVRSQMDIRICFRVRERKDVDLILGQGMLTAGWNAHTLNAPGKFLVSAPEHDVPRRARAYLLTDDMVSTTAAHHADMRPALDEVSRQAINQARIAIPRPDPDMTASHSDADGQADDDPMVILWAALSVAPDQGVAVPDLMEATRMSRPWVYQRLRELVGRRQVTQVTRGRWRAVTEHTQ